MFLVGIVRKTRMSSLLFHPQLRFVILLNLPVKDQLQGYRPINSQSMEAVEEHIKEAVVEHVKGSEVDYAVADVTRQYWEIFCRLGFVASNEFRPTLETMFSESSEPHCLQQSSAAVCWLRVGELLRSSKTACGRELKCGTAAATFSPLDCWRKALEKDSALARAWIQASKELLCMLRIEDPHDRAVVAGQHHTARSAALQGVRCAPDAPAGWLQLSLVLEAEGGTSIEALPGVVVDECQCFIRGVECPTRQSDAEIKSRLWSNLGVILYRNLHCRQGATSFTVADRDVGAVDCFVESVRCWENSCALELLAKTMRGIFPEQAPGPRIRTVDRVEIFEGQSWTALDCIARGLRCATDNESIQSCWIAAGEILHAAGDATSEKLVVNGQSYDMMQCFVKAAIAEDGEDGFPSPALNAYYHSYYMGWSTQTPVLVDGAAYFLVLHPRFSDTALRWERREIGKPTGRR